MTDRVPVPAAVAALTLALAACSRSLSPEPAATEAAPVEEPAPPLLGEAPSTTPPPQDETGLLGGPPAPGAENGAAASATMRFTRPDGVVVSTMKTIPDEAAQAPPAPPPHAVRHATPRHRPHAEHRTVVVSSTPPVSAAAPVQGKPAPAAPAVLAKAPDAPLVAAVPLARPADPVLAKLQTAVAGATSSGAVLSAPEDLARGRSGQVQLTLPKDFAARLRAEAAKLCLAPAARTAEVTAALHGVSYKITPEGPQTAPLPKDDEEIVFRWQVEPRAAAARQPLSAEANVALTGEGQARTFQAAALAETIEKPAAAPGQTSAKWVLAGILGLLAALVLGGVWRDHKERRRAAAERRQRERAAQAFAEPAQPGAAELAEPKAD